MFKHLWILLALVLMAGCGSGDATGDKTDPTILRINLGAEPRTLDPTLMTDLVGSMVIASFFEPLTATNGKGEIVPRAAESWSHDADYKVWTFKLRPNGRWHNGDPVRAQDFVYGVERILTPGNQAQYATYVLGFLEGADTFYKGGGLEKGLKLDAVRAIDDLTVEYRLRNPTPYFHTVVPLFSWLPIHKPTVDQHGAAWANDPKTFIGNGPFRLESYQSKDVIVGKLADTYWNKSAMYWSQVNFLMIESETTEAAAFREGEIDVTVNIPIPELEEWSKTPSFRNFRFYGTQYLNVNHRRAPFNDARVRHAFSLAVDRQHLVKKVTRRDEIIAEGVVPRPLASVRGGDYRDVAGNFVEPFNIEKARALMAEAGYGPNGKPFPAIEYLYDAKEENRAVAEQLQAMWSEAFGIDVRLQQVEWGVRLSRTQKGDFDIALSNWYGDYLDAMTFLELFTSDSSYNVSEYRSPEYDKFVNGARVEGNAEKREDLMIAGERVMIKDEMAVIPLYNLAKPILINPNLEGVIREITGGLVYVDARRKTTP